MLVGVVDYGIGNVRSVRSALERLGAQVQVTSDEGILGTCERLILPGVGSFPAGMENLHARGLDQSLPRLVHAGTPLLGICLGMQLLAANGTEGGLTAGLGLVDATVERFPHSDRPVPHVGFNTVHFTAAAQGLHARLGPEADFYFVHSYRMVCRRREDVAGWCDYGGEFAAIVRTEHVLGTQFHPEKSQSNGLKLLAAFLSLGG